MTGLTADEWAALADAKATTWTVGTPGKWLGLYADPGEAADAAMEAPGGSSLVQWEGRSGHVVPALYWDPSARAQAAPELEAEAG